MQIAAAFVLNRVDYLPTSYNDIVEAWDRLDEDWQGYVGEKWAFIQVGVGERHNSVLDLQIHTLTSEDAAGGFQDIYMQARPELNIADDIHLFYELLESEFDVLEPFGPDREMVFSLA